jgi:uncharacterized protein YkuJ
MSPERLARDHELCAIEALFRFQRNGVRLCRHSFAARRQRFELRDKDRRITRNRDLFESALRARDDPRGGGWGAESICQERAQGMIGFAALSGASHARCEHGRSVGKLSRPVNRVAATLRRETAGDDDAFVCPAPGALNREAQFQLTCIAYLIVCGGLFASVTLIAKKSTPVKSEAPL